MIGLRCNHDDLGINTIDLRYSFFLRSSIGGVAYVTVFNSSATKIGHILEVYYLLEV